jgi:hypothetical protein
MKIANLSRGRAIAASALAVGLSLCAAARASATTATWTGAGTSVAWSAGANWGGGAAPSGGLDVLSLPASSPGCQGWACGYAVDDIPSLAVGTLQLDSSTNYLVAPMSSVDSLTLTGGLSFGTSSPTAGDLLTTMVVPVTLGAAQTWNVSGVAGTPTQLTLGAVTGEAYPLTLDLANGVMLQAPELDTGPLTISGAGRVSLAGQTTPPADSIPVSPPALMSTQGVALANGASLMFSRPGVVSGPISVAPGSYSTLEVGRGVAPDGTVVVAGDVMLRASSTLQEWIDQPAVAARVAQGGRAKPATPQPSADYSQISALGDVVLNGASLNLSQGYSDTQVVCAAMTGGQTFTLLSATQLIGTFSRIANGQVVPLGACDPSATGRSYAVVISYNTRARPQTVTATVVGPAQIKAEVSGALVVDGAAASVNTILRKGGYTATFDAPAVGTLALSWRARVNGRMVTVASGTKVTGQVGPRHVSIKLTAAGRALLQRSQQLTLKATANFTRAGQTTVSASRPVRLG